jgi:hypothetical protein
MLTRTDKRCQASRRVGRKRSRHLAFRNIGSLPGLTGFSSQANLSVLRVKLCVTVAGSVVMLALVMI